MANITTDIPNLDVSVFVDDITLLGEVKSINIQANELTAIVEDGLSDDKYDELAKQLRILYALSFEEVYSEDYTVYAPPNHSSSFGGHNERKNHLLQASGPVSDSFARIAEIIFRDLLKSAAKVPQQTRFFNLAYIWARAHELDELNLMTEAYTQYWRILDEMHAKGNKAEAMAALESFDFESTASNIFAARVLASIGREKRKSAKAEIIEIAQLDRLRHPHVHQAGGRQKYYMEEDTHLEAEINNWFISMITKLYILWQLGLTDYYLSPRDNIYELKKYETTEG